MQFDDFRGSELPSVPELATEQGAQPIPAPAYRKARELVGQCKTCTKCQAEKDLSEFAIKRGSRASRCRACQKEMSDAHYRANKDQVKASAAVRNDVQRNVLQTLRDAYLSTCKCEKCESRQKLRLRTKPGFTGLAAHEVINGALAVSHLETAIANSRVLCEKCLGQENVVAARTVPVGRDDDSGRWTSLEPQVTEAQPA